MDDSRILNIVLKLQDQATNKLAPLSTQLGMATDDAKKVTAAAAIMGGAALAAGTYAVKMASDFQSSMTLIQTQAGASAKEVDMMSKAILNLAPAVGSTPKQLADALFFIESAGYSGAKALDILKLSAEGAKVGEADLADTAKAVTSILNSHIKGVKDASDAIGQMNAIVGAGKMKMEELNSALSSGILASAQSFGLSLKDVGSALDTMTNAGVPAEEAATRLRMTFSLIEAPTSKASTALQSIGMTSRQMADDMRNGGLLSALEDLSKHMNAVIPASTSVVKGTKMSAEAMASLSNKIANTQTQLKIYGEEHVKAGLATDKHNLSVTRATETLAGYQSKLSGANQTVTTFGGGMLDATQKAQLMSDMFGGGRTSSAMLTLVNNLDQVKSRLKQVNDTSDNFAAAWQKTQEDNAFAMQKLGATVNTLAVRFGIALLPEVTKIANFLATNLGPAIDKTTAFLEKHKILVEIVAGALLGFLAAAAIVPVIVAIGTAFSIFGAVMAALAVGGILPAIGVAIAALGGPITLIVIAIGTAAALIITHWGTIKTAAENFAKTVSGIFTGFVNTVKTIWRMLTDFFTGGDVTLFPNEAKNKALVNFAKFLDGVKDTFNNVITATKNLVTGIVNFLVTPLLLQFNIIKFALTFLWDFFVLTWAQIQALLTAFSNWFYNTFGKQIQAGFNIVITYLKNLWQQWTTIWNQILSSQQILWSQITTTTSSALLIVQDFIFNQLSAITNWINKQFINPVNTAWTGFWNNMKSTVTTIASDIKTIAKDMINSIIGWIDGLINGFNSMGAHVSGFVKLPTIPHLATGTNFFQGGMALVGENGPELVNLPRGSQVIPNNQINSNNHSSSSAVNIAAVYVTDPGDINLLAQRLDFLMRTSGRY